MATGIPILDSMGGMFGKSSVVPATFIVPEGDGSYTQSNTFPCAINPATIVVSMSKGGLGNDNLDEDDDEDGDKKNNKEINTVDANSSSRKQRKKKFQSLTISDESITVVMEMNLILDSFSELGFWDKQMTRPNSFSKISGLVSSVKKASGGGSKLKEGLLSFVGQSSYATILSEMNVNRQDGLLKALQIAYDQQRPIIFTYGKKAFANIQGWITSLSTTFVMFSSNGDPIRADVGIQMVLADANTATNNGKGEANPMEGKSWFERNWPQDQQKKQPDAETAGNNIGDDPIATEQ